MSEIYFQLLIISLFIELCLRKLKYLFMVLLLFRIQPDFDNILRKIISLFLLLYNYFNSILTIFFNYVFC